MNRPAAAARTAFGAAPSPGVRLAHEERASDLTIPAESSVDPSSTTMISIDEQPCSRTLAEGVAQISRVVENTG